MRDQTISLATPCVSAKSRILLADDHMLMLEGIRLMLQQEFELVGSVTDGQALLTTAKNLQPDLILLEISMPVLNGIDAAGQLQRILPSAKLLFVTMHADADYVVDAFRAGASGYLLKRSAASELLTAVREVLKGNYYISPAVARAAITSLIAASADNQKRSDSLTVRQRQVLQLLGEGRRHREIAMILTISVKTVEFHKATLVRRLNLRTAADFTRYAVEHRLINSELPK